MTRDDQIAEIVMRWEEAFDHGSDLPVADLCADHPELVEPFHLESLLSSSWAG